ncbi:glucose-6-phosphate isomerase [Aliamphritea hakodatensis]|uniref:glucose-6-phosphate isomerase n=1 Tax=Aliamphritea hakodatensis TaxID=2895352 RepID=UPI0022FD7BC6|nr:glucose-6-phosphate isomerase [Aliamphritea hakodatensis]
MSITSSAAWQALQTHAEQVKQTHIKDMFAQQPARFSELSFQTEHLLLDLSKQRFQLTTVDLLVRLATAQQLPTKIQAMFDGAILNPSENRPALHSALRQPRDKSLALGDTDVIADVHHSLDAMEQLVKRIHRRQWRGYDGSPIQNVVNIGVGGSDLGPLMCCKALSEWVPEEARQLNIHFVSSMDGSQLERLLHQLDPASTLFIISSKSFSTIDTLANAKTAREWLINASGAPAEIINQHHFIGVTSKAEKAASWGIPLANQLHFWDWTGGRYSLWSVIGFPIALHIGMENFHRLLAGAHQMDEHFRTTELSDNLPVLLALTDIWNINFLDIHAHAILPYDGRLSHLPAYLEQLEMESNGKNVSLDGQVTDYRTCPILWGEIGSNAQHAFYQLLHQGTEAVMCDFIVPAQRYQHASTELQQQHQLALANCLAQSRLLALGDSILDAAEQAPAHKRYQGNQPSSTIMLKSLNPETLGELIALYEHKVFVQSVIWNINPFDQWGVELGKVIATELLSQFDDDDTSALDSSTAGLIDFIQSNTGTRHTNDG